MTTLSMPRRTWVLSATIFTAVALAVVVVVVALQLARRAPPAHEGHEAVSGDAHAGHGAPASTSPAAPEGYAAVHVEPGRLAPLALSTAPVEEKEVTKAVRTVGLVTLDETRTAHVHSKVRGWIDTIAVNFVGREVKAGEVLCTIYSQEVYAAEIELLAVLGQGGPLLEAARRRLAQWDVPRSEIARLERSREARRTFPLLAPRPGTVIARQALQGMYVDSSVELYTLSELSSLWVLADVYDADVPHVTEGAPARLRVEGVAEPIETKVAFLSPTLDEATRTRKVRFELPNAGGRLLAGAFVSAELDVPAGRGLTVPESAVIRTGKRSIVFVAHGEPATHFEPREVQLGTRAGDEFLVTGGLAAGERVATGAQFLLDSESRIRASSRPGGAHAGH